ncbi:MAG: SLC13 family permease [Verrucomicrobia bacterium]|nr:SLC13 family permease [Verrucomicrobiota bacterium]
MVLEQWQQEVFMVVLVVAVFAAFIREWLSIELVAIGALVLCVAAGILPVATTDPALFRFDALRVFAHPAPITVACMFILSSALEKTGVVEALGHQFERLAATSPTRMLFVLMVFVAFVSAFMNNTPVVVVFMPIVIAICRRKDWKASKFLIPLSYASIVGGTMTMIGTSTNLVAAGILAEKGYKPMAMFDVTPLGLVFVLVAVIYMMTLGRKLLPDRVTLASLIDSEQSREFITHAFVGRDSALAGAAFLESGLAKMRKARVLEVIRNGQRVTQPLNQIVFEGGDEIVFKGQVEGLMGISETEGIKLRGNESMGLEAVRTESALLMEGIIGPDSSLAGKSLRELNFRQRFGVIILAVHRRGRNLRERFEDEKLSFGDTILVQGPAEQMRQLFEMRDFINLSESKGTVLRPKRAPVAIVAIVGFMVLGALIGFGVVPEIPVVMLAMGAALLVLLTGCVDPKEAYRSIDWKVIFLICGMLGLGMALERSGLAGRLAGGLAEVVGDNRYLMIGALYLTAMLLTEVISNNAVAALLAPLAIVLGQKLGLDDPRPLVIAVMFGASASFLTPIGYQTNTFVYGAGGYRFGDFLRTGAPLSVLLWLAATALIPVIWPF